MSVVAQLNKWLAEKTLIRITALEKGKGRQIHVGNIIFVDEQGSNILFYDLDQKKNYNISINEIEDIQPYQSRAKQIIESNIARAARLKKENNGNSRNNNMEEHATPGQSENKTAYKVTIEKNENKEFKKDKTGTESLLPTISVCPVGPQGEEQMKEDIREEVIALVRCMSSKELYALYPLLQVLVEKEGRG